MAIMKTDGTTNQGFQSWIIDPLKTNIYFLYSMGDLIKKEALKNASGSTFLEISNSEVKKLKIKYSSKPEQDKIGNLLSKLDNTLTLLQQREEKLYSFKRRLNQHFFREAYMKNFSKRSISSLGDIYSGLSGKNKSDFDHGKGHYITYININRNLISDIDGINTIEIDNKQNLVRKGDILFTLSSETPDEVGLASVWLYDLSNTYLNSFSFGFRPNNQILDSLYLGYFFRSDYFRKKSFPLAQGISRYNLSKKSFLNLTIPIPTLKIQQKIAHTLYTVDNLISKNKNITSTLYKLKQFLLQNMFI